MAFPSALVCRRFAVSKCVYHSAGSFNINLIGSRCKVKIVVLNFNISITIHLNYPISQCYGYQTKEITLDIKDSSCPGPFHIIKVCEKIQPILPSPKAAITR